MKYVFDDGGRAAAGYKGITGDCVVRSIAIATGQPYQKVYDVMAAGNASQRKTKGSGWSTGRKIASGGISVKRKWFKDYMKSIG